MSLDNPLKRLLCLDNFLEPEKCDYIINQAEKNGNWTKNRHENYPTTDIPIDNIEGLGEIKDTLMEKLSKEIQSYYCLGEDSVISPFDLFVVKYETNGQSSLDIHRDASEFSFILLLSDPQDFTGGGTYYQEKDILIQPKNKGAMTVHFGKVKHGGNKITEGVRYIMIGFLHVESKMIMKPLESENKYFSKLSNCDKRYYDFYWCGGKRKEIKISTKIINLKHRKEKLERMFDALNKVKVPKEIDFTFEFIEADEGENGEVLDNWQKYEIYAPDHIKRFYSREITKGEIGCFNSHKNIIDNFDGSGYLLILEDDARFHSDLLYRISQVIDELYIKNMYWDAIDFGGITVDNTEDVKVTESLVTKGHIFQAHCILYSKNGIEKLRYNKNNKIIPWDDFLTAIQGKNFINELNDLYVISPKFILYNYYDQLSWQSEDNIHDTESTEGFCDYDMINWYKFSELTEQSYDKIEELFKNANSNMWNFHISTISGSFQPKYEVEWQQHVDKRKKLVAIYMIDDNSKLELYNKCNTNFSKNNVIIFPSYLLFKCSNVAIFYANGTTFK